LKNFTNLFKSDCPAFGKLLYLYLAEGFHRCRIRPSRFIKRMLPLFDKDRHHFKVNALAFAILDVDRDGELSILNLVHLCLNIPLNTKIGREVIK